jgi:hypothetical protein
MAYARSALGTIQVAWEPNSMVKDNVYLGETVSKTNSSQRLASHGSRKIQRIGQHVL